MGELRRKRALRRGLDTLLPPLTGVLGVAAAAVVVTRLMAAELGELGPIAHWFVVGAAGLVGLALAVRAWPRRESDAIVSGHLDQRCGAEGLIMALAAQPAQVRDPVWMAQIAEPLSTLRIERGRPRAMYAACLAGLLLLCTAATPVLEPIWQPPPRPERAFAGLAEQMERLATAELIPEPELTELRERLDELTDGVRSQGMTSAAWEGLDRLDQDVGERADATLRRLAQAISEAEEAARLELKEPGPEETPREATGGGRDRSPEERDHLGRRNRDRLGRDQPPTDPAESAAMRERSGRMLDRLSRGRDREQLRNLARALAELASRAPGAVPRLSRQQEQALAELAKEAAELGELSEEDLKALLDAIEAARSAAGTSSPPNPGEDGEGVRPLTPDELRELVDAIRKGLDQSGERVAGAGLKPELQRILARLTALRLAASRGGISRGGSGARLTRSDEDAERIGRETELAPGTPLDEGAAIDVGVSARAPDLDPATGEARRRAAAHVLAPGHADARRAAVAPRHRGAVRRYFAPPPPD